MYACAYIILCLNQLLPNLKIKSYDNSVAVYTLNGTNISDLINKELPIWLTDFMLLSVKSGNISITVNYKTYVLNKNSIFSNFDKNIITKIEFSEDLDAYLVISESSFLKKSIIENGIIVEDVVKSMKSCPLLIYENIDFMWLNTYITKLIELLEKKSLDNQRKMIEEVLMYFLVDIMKHSEQSKEVVSRYYKELVVSQYFELVKDGFMTDKLVSDYVNKLEMEATKMSYIIRSHVGESPLDIIHDLIIAESKMLLLNFDFTIGQISKDLGYYDQAAFFKIFISKVGTGPKQYRRRFCRLSSV